MPKTTAPWFALVGDGLRDIVDDHGGALAMSGPEWREALKHDNVELQSCPNCVFEHVSLALKPRGMACCALRGNDGKIVVIYDAVKFTPEAARAHCEEMPLSPGAQEYYEEFDTTEVVA